MTCNCSENLVCLRHYTSLCSCPPEKHTLRYRYTLDELPLMLQKLKLKAESFDNWVNLVKDALDPNTPKTLDLSQFKELVKEAEEKKFPKSELLQTLTMAVEDADKCASVIHQLDLNKIRTRTRNSADTKYKLTVEELTLFCEEIDSLACTLKEAKSVKDLLNQTQEFQKESHRLLILPLVQIDSTELENCIDSVSGFCIELPEIKPLRNKLAQKNWLTEVRNVRSREDLVTVETLRTLLATGIALPVDTLLETELAELQNILTDVDEWEEKAKKLAASDPHSTLSEYEKLLTAAESIEAFLPTEESLRDIVKRAKEWTKMINEIQSGENYPYFDTLEEIIKKGRNIPVNLKELERLENQYNSAKIWKERTARTFLRKNSNQQSQLMEALSPRSFSSPTHKPGKKRPANADDEGIIGSVSHIKLGKNLEPVQVVSAFKDAEEKEMDGIRNLRNKNIRKFQDDTTESELYCTCSGPLSGLMFQCDLCKDWYHSLCVPLPKAAALAPSGKHSKSNQAHLYKDTRFLCPHCNRTRRPRLETILSLLVSLQKLSVRLPEGEALQCLTERAMNWQDRARQLLCTGEIVAALTKISIRATNPNDIANDLKRLTHDGDLRSRVHKELSPRKEEDEISSEESMESFPLMNASSGSVDCPKSPPKNKSDDFQNDEHAYSLNLNLTDSGHSSPSLVTISDGTKEHLEDLLMEGDLLEVSLDETNHIWKLLRACRLDADRTCMDFDVSSTLFSYFSFYFDYILLCIFCF